MPFSHRRTIHVEQCDKKGTQKGSVMLFSPVSHVNRSIEFVQCFTYSPFVSQTHLRGLFSLNCTFSTYLNFTILLLFSLLTTTLCKLHTFFRLGFISGCNIFGPSSMLLNKRRSETTMYIRKKLGRG